MDYTEVLKLLTEVITEYQQGSDTTKYFNDQITKIKGSTAPEDQCDNLAIEALNSIRDLFANSTLDIAEMKKQALDVLKNMTNSSKTLNSLNEDEDEDDEPCSIEDIATFFLNTFNTFQTMIPSFR